MFFWFGTRLSQHPRIKSSTNVQLLFKLGDNDAWFKIKLQSLLDCKASYWSNQRSLFYSIISKSYIYNCTHFHINQYKLIIWYIISRQCYLSLMFFFFFLYKCQEHLVGVHPRNLHVSNLPRSMASKKSKIPMIATERVGGLISNNSSTAPNWLLKITLLF